MNSVRDTYVPLPDEYDVPESHGDALAQVIECQSQIGWRQHSRRVVLLATDATFHIAGDGVSVVRITDVPYRLLRGTVNFWDTWYFYMKNPS